MKFSRLLPAGLLLVANLALGAPATGELALPEGVYPGLDGILKKAVQQSPRMLSRALDVEIAEQNRITARAGLLPSLGGSFSYFKASDDRADLPERQEVTKIAYNVTLSQALFHWGERRNTARIGEIQKRIVEGQYREAYRLLSQELRANYLRLIVLKLGVKRAHFNQDFLGKKLVQDEDRASKGVISEVEIAASRLAAEQAVNAVDRADFDYQSAKLSFARLSGSGAVTDESIPDSVPGLPYGVEPYQQLLSGFLGQKDLPSAEAVVLRNQIEVEKLQYANQKTRLRPKVNALVASTQDEQSYTQNVAQKYRVDSIYAGVSVYWTIFDGFAAKAGARASLARRRQMEIDYRQLTERLGQDAQNQLRGLEFSSRNMSIYDRYLNKSETNLASMQDQFRRGARSETEVALAQINLYDSQANAMTARIDFFLKVGDFLGVIVEDPVLANLPAQ